MIMKDVFVILGFHAHEPIWDMTQRLLDAIDDPLIKATFPSDNWIRKRIEAGRDLYGDLLDFSRDLDVPVALEATNEVLEQIAQYAPDCFAALGDGYRSGRIAPVYGHAYHTHIGLMNDREVEEEITLNRDFIHRVVGAPRPVRQGLFPSEDGLDGAKLRGIEAAGIEYVLFPNLSPRKGRYRVCGRPDVTYQPFKIGRRLIALPRHFAVSQYIWRPITRLLPEGVRSQGFLMGQFNVFEEEYRSGRRLSYPITWEQAVEDYRSVLDAALDAAPDRGLILYMQDLELMDFGDTALRIMR
ncbi:MAG: glycoside hydrolase, partial [Chloroflexi bacterium]|nr:glycoside hydrolase [Chloroflexota bacterium]